MRISDWSSDVCSSDLQHLVGMRAQGVDQQIVDMIEAASRHVGTGDFEGDRRHDQARSRMCTAHAAPQSGIPPTVWARPSRSEERRVGKEWVRTWRSRGSQDREKEKSKTEQGNNRK